MKHLFTLKSLMLTLVMLFGLNAWGETLTKSWDLTKASSDWVGSGNVDYFNQPYGFKKVNGTLTNKSIADFSVAGITEIKVGFKCLQNGSTTSKLTIYLVDENGNALGDGQVVTPVNASAATKTTYQYATFTSGFEGATGFMMKVTTFGKNILVNGAEYTVTYETVASAVATPTITETSTADDNGDYYTTSTATATIDCATQGAAIKYAITDGSEPADAEWSVYSAEVSINSEAVGTKTLWAKAVKDADESSTVSKVFTFIEKPELITYEQVTSESQIVPGRKYVIACTSATEKAVMNVIESGKSFFSAVKSHVSYADNKLSFVNSDAVYVTFEKAAASFANGHAKDDATTIWNVKIGDKYITSTTEKKMVMSADAPTNITMSIDAEGNFVLNFGANYFCYNSGAPRFTTYDSQGTGNSDVEIQLFREPEAMASVMSAAAETAVELPVSVVGRKVFGNYLLASTVNNGGAQLESPSLEEAKHFWSNDPEKFNQESWIAIAGLDESYVGKEFEIGQTLTAAGADATYGFPTYTVATPSTFDYTVDLAINNYSASNFNIGGTDESVAKVWLVAPQLGEYCQIHGYVDADLADETYAWVQANEKSNVYATVYFNGLPKFTTSGWYNIEGVVAKDGEGLAIYATAVDTATGVEGVEASSVKVYGAEGVINVVSEEVAPIAVYSANGAIVSSVEASSASIAVAPGFYIVKAGNSVSKVTVK